MSSIYKRGSVWYLKAKSDSGRWVYKSLHTTIKREAIETKLRIDSARAGMPRPKPKEPPAPTVTAMSIDAALELWTTTNAPILRPASIGRMGNMVTAFVRLTDVKLVAEINEEVVERFRDGLIAEGRTAWTTSGYLTNLRTLLKLLIRKKLLFVNAAEGVKAPSIAKGVPKFLDSKQIEDVMEMARLFSIDMSFFFGLAIYAGLRKSEISACRWEWVDFSARTLTVQSGHGWSPKDKDARVIPLSKKLAAILDPYRQPEGYVLRPDKQLGNYRYRVETRRPYANIVKAAGVEWASPHVLRHTFASQLAKAGISLYKIQMWLGHSDPKTTMIYSHLGRDHDEDIDSF